MWSDRLVLECQASAQGDLRVSVRRKLETWVRHVAHLDPEVPQQREVQGYKCGAKPTTADAAAVAERSRRFL